MELLKPLHAVIVDNCLLRKDRLNIEVKVVANLTSDLLGLIDGLDLVLDLSSELSILSLVLHDALKDFSVLLLKMLSHNLLSSSDCSFFLL